MHPAVVVLGAVVLIVTVTVTPDDKLPRLAVYLLALAGVGVWAVAQQVDRVRELIEEWQIEQSRASRGLSDDTG